MPALHFITAPRQCRVCRGCVPFHETGSTRVGACWELCPCQAGLAACWGQPLQQHCSPGPVTSAKERWSGNKELTGHDLSTPGKAPCVTQIPMWELRSSSHCSRWLWLEFTTLSAAETQPNASWLRFPARRTSPYSTEQHPHVPHCTPS